MRRILPALLFVTVVAATFPGPTLAQRRDDPLRFLRWPVQDAAGLVTGFSGAEWVATAGAGAGLLILSQYDRALTDQVAGITEGTHVTVIEEFGNVKVVRPMATVILLGAFMSGDDRFQDAAFTSLQAVIYSNLVTNLLKTAVGRSRPYQEQGPSSFEPFNGGTSFPSGHSTTAFAFLTPWFLYYGGVAGGALLIVATATAFSRMATNFHWFSDVVGGSAIGYLTARALVRRHQGKSGRIDIQPTLGPAGVGLEMRF